MTHAVAFLGRNDLYRYVHNKDLHRLNREFGIIQDDEANGIEHDENLRCEEAYLLYSGGRGPGSRSSWTDGVR